MDATVVTDPLPAPSQKDAFAEIEGVKLHYIQKGQGTPVVLLHGWGSEASHWHMVFNDLAQNFAVTAVDLPGHGQSALPPEPWGVKEYSECILKLLDRFNIQKAHFIGHSFGGRICVWLGATVPERVEKIILVNSSGLKPKRTWKYHFRVALAKVGKFVAAYGGKPGQWLKAKLYSKIASRDYANAGPLRATFVKTVNEDLSSVAPLVKAPTLLIWGENDEETRVEMAQRYNALIPGSKLVVLKEAGHYSYIDQFNKFKMQVQNHLFT